MVGEGRSNLFVDVVLNVQITGVARRSRSHGRIPQVYTDLDLTGIAVEIALSVEVEIGDVVAKVHHQLLAISSANRVRRTHIGRVEAENILQCNLVPNHLVLTLRCRHLVEVLVRPSVASNLVALGDHALDDIAVLHIDHTLAKVVAGDEKGGDGAMSFEGV